MQRPIVCYGVGHAGFIGMDSVGFKDVEETGVNDAHTAVWVESISVMWFANWERLAGWIWYERENNGMNMKSKCNGATVGDT